MVIVMMYSLHEMDRINQGIEIGIERGRILTYYEMNLPIDEISKKMNLSEDKIWNIINFENNKSNN